MTNEEVEKWAEEEHKKLAKDFPYKLGYNQEKPQIVLYIKEDDVRLLLYKLSCGHQSLQCTELRNYIQQAGNNRFGW